MYKCSIKHHLNPIDLPYKKITHCKRQFVRHLKHRIKDRVNHRVKTSHKKAITRRIKVHGRPYYNLPKIQIATSQELSTRFFLTTRSKALRPKNCWTSWKPKISPSTTDVWWLLPKIIMANIIFGFFVEKRIEWWKS